MPHYTPLISTIVVALVLAFAFGVLGSGCGFRRSSATSLPAS
jgi:predicted Kef-type K+ transport protein